jgi:hypothetical protein
MSRGQETQATEGEARLGRPVQITVEEGREQEARGVDRQEEVREAPVREASRPRKTEASPPLNAVTRMLARSAINEIRRATRP